MATLYVVHCIDTEGPLTETLSATFQRLNGAFGLDLAPTRENLRKLQNRELDLGGREAAVARMIAPELLAYNSSWEKIREMLDDALSDGFRRRLVDDFGNGWIYSWHCMDHLHYVDNPRHKDVGYGNVFRFYRDLLAESRSGQDELNWHFHPTSLTGNPLQAATSYLNSYGVLIEILCRRILDDAWFPVVNRPGFHAERPDSHAFLEQWIPFDYANQSHEDDTDQPDLAGGRFGDWRRAPSSWRGYQPSHDDYQTPGACRRTIFRCLNVGTRLRPLKSAHVRQAFLEARQGGKAVLAFADHDYRDIRPDVEAVRAMIAEVRLEFPDVSLKFSGAEAAARDLLEVSDRPAPKLSLVLEGNTLVVRLEHGAIFGPQPFLAMKGLDGRVFHDNLDIQQPGHLWTYVFDDQTLPVAALSTVGVGSAGRFGGSCVALLSIRQ
ncbi:MAG: hypothetical protein NTV11_00475 [Rhodocyclales bacterium]|nr:hypothetical protein [Rhodocyclales bacterium]